VQAQFLSCVQPIQKVTRSAGGADGLPTKLLFGYLFSDHEKGMKFLQGSRLLKNEMTCLKCSSNMHVWKSQSIINNYHWQCGKRKRDKACNATQGLRNSSWFSKGKLTLLK
jgi:hypothetical protein